MATFDSILRDARSLALDERARLARMLLDEANAEKQSDELGVGQRGLAAWTDSTVREDWSEFYPASLRQREVG